jgi:cell division protein FtsN
MVLETIDILLILLTVLVLVFIIHLCIKHSYQQNKNELNKTKFKTSIVLPDNKETINVSQENV